MGGLWVKLALVVELLHLPKGGCWLCPTSEQLEQLAAAPVANPLLWVGIWAPLLRGCGQATG